MVCDERPIARPAPSPSPTRPISLPDPRSNATTSPPEVGTTTVPAATAAAPITGVFSAKSQTRAPVAASSRYT